MKRILVLASPAMQPTPALRHGIALARNSGAELHLCIVDYDHFIDRAGDLVHPDVRLRAQKQFLRERMDWLSQQAVALTEAHRCRVDTDVIWARHAHEAAIAKVLQLRPDLTLMDANVDAETGAPARPTPAQWKILRLLPGPLLLAHPASQRLPGRIAAAVDVREYEPYPGLNGDIVSSAIRLSLYVNAGVQLVHAFPYGRAYKTQYRFLGDALGDIRQADAARFAEFAGHYGVPNDRRHWLDGDAVSALTGFARSGAADLLVIGALYRSAFDRLMLGSTAEQVIAKTPCDVLLIKPGDFVEQLRRHLDLDELRQRYGLEEIDPPEAGRKAA